MFVILLYHTLILCSGDNIKILLNRNDNNVPLHALHKVLAYVMYAGGIASTNICLIIDNLLHSQTSCINTQRPINCQIIS